MSISGISNYPVLPLPSSRGGQQDRSSFDTRRSEDDTDRKNSRFDPAYQGPVTNRQELSSQQRVEPTGRAKEIFARRQTESDALSFGAKKALDAFAANASSAEQPLGIELAGIDVFV